MGRSPKLKLEKILLIIESKVTNFFYDPILSTSGDHKNLKAYANPAQLKSVTVLLSTPALVNQTERVENTKSIGNPEEKPNIIIFKGFSVKKNKNLLFNYLLQKEGKKIISKAKISNLPNIIPADNNHFD